jgi:hypothetical protein
MASMQGYFYMIIGLSLLLGLAGVGTLGGGILSIMGVDITTSDAGNTTISGIENINTISNPFLGSLSAIIIGLGIAGLSVLSGKFSLGESLKVGAASFLLVLMINELRAILQLAGTLTSFSFLIQLVAYVIYIPLMGGITIMIYNWISGTA